MLRPLLLAVLALALSAAPASAVVNNFEGSDGNQECGIGLTDWRCLPSDWDLQSADEASVANDDVFSGGKEEIPNGWTFDLDGKATSAKTDITNLWSTAIYDQTAAAPYLFLAFHRVEGGTSDAFFTFELNQVRTTWVNALGTEVPCRTDGDVLLSYELPSTITLYSWNGSGGPVDDPVKGDCPDGATGTWTGPVGPLADREAGVNDGATPITSYFSDGPATMTQRTFGEAALNLAQVVREVGLAQCTYFQGVQAHSRTSNSFSSTMSDFVADTPIGVVACPTDPGNPPAATPTMNAPSGCVTGGTLTLSGTAAPGTQVEVLEGTTSRGLAATTPAGGTWSLTIPATNGSHTYTAIAHQSGKTDSAGVSRTVVVDGTRPLAPTVTSPAAGATVTPGAVTVSGTSEPLATIEITEAGTVVGQATASAAGAWSTTVTVAAGSHTLSVTAADCAAGAATTVTFVAATGTGPDPDGSGGDTSGTGGGPTGPQTPQQEILGEGDAGTCATKVFKVYLPGKGVKRVVFRVDGKKVKTVKRKDAKKRFVFKVDPKLFAAGKHKITARILLRNGKKRTVPMRSFTRCKLGKCVSRRSFRIRVKKIRGEKVTSATVKVNGKKVKVVRGKRLTAPVVLTGLPKGKVVVKIISRTKSGRKVTDTRRYKTCVPGKKKTP
jgi:hypothetical protein